MSQSSGVLESGSDARRAALAAMDRVAVQGTGVVNFSTGGQVLVLGQSEDAVSVARQLPKSLSPTVVLFGEASASGKTGFPVLGARRGAFDLEGHLGDFRARLQPGGEVVRFDLVVDLCDPPLLTEAWPRFGYHAAAESGIDAAALAETLQDEVGAFEKPRYFRYDPDICVRGRSGLIACNRCVQACPAGAITGLAERVEVDPYLCQGGGICATVCPSGAMGYAYPHLEDSVSRMRRLLQAFVEAGGKEPQLLIHEAKATPVLDDLPGGVLPFAAEEIGSLGPEFWLSAIAFGARAVRLENPGGLASGMRNALDVQLMFVSELLQGLGFPAGVVGWQGETPASPMPAIRSAAFAAAGAKREVLYLALDHLAAESPLKPAEVELPASAPLGEILIDAGRCTLCVSCATVCPAGAVTADEDRPALVFFEAKCVQCGVCAQACPEKAIDLRARVLTDRAERNRRRLLHEEPPFECVRCGKPFATPSAIDGILVKLEGHPMFSDEASRRRLKMCGDCRVIDMAEHDGAM